MLKKNHIWMLSLAGGFAAALAAGCNDSYRMPPARTDSGQVIEPPRDGTSSAAGATRGRAGASVGTDTTGGSQGDATIRSGRGLPGSVTDENSTRTIDRGGGIGPTGANGMGSGTPPDRRNVAPESDTNPRSGGTGTSTSGGTSSVNTSNGNAGTTGDVNNPNHFGGATTPDTGRPGSSIGNSNSQNTGTSVPGGNSSTSTEDQLRRDQSR